MKSIAQRFPVALNRVALLLWHVCGPQENPDAMALPRVVEFEEDTLVLREELVSGNRDRFPQYRDGPRNSETLVPFGEGCVLGDCLNFEFAPARGPQA